MSGRTTYSIRQFARDMHGTTLVELAIVLPIFLLIFFGLIDFGRMGAEYVMAEKAMQRAARIAAVRPPACADVPTAISRGTVPPNTVPPRFGTLCSAGANICAAPAPITCTGNAADPTTSEIWASISGIMPTTSTPANLSFTYEYDPALGFLGGPYVPVITVEIQNLNFQFTSPLGGLATLAGATGNNLPGTLQFPTMSVSLPAEDLALGNNG
ncbi:MAG: pilus assembly protein [Marinosulfonomonas sp.]|nr:pilus assembly protein [Marinosulfonomonas sp.]